MHLFTIPEIKEILRLNQIPNAIFSNLFVEQLCFGINSGQYHSQIIVDQIRKIQNCETLSVKEPRNFKCDILRGFKYFHWFEMKFLPKNLMNYWKLNDENSNSKKLNDLIKKCCKEIGLKKNDNINIKVTNMLAKKFVYEGLHEKERKNELTGEWIIFYNKDGINIFLSLALHTEKDEDIFLRMANNCQLEFPDLFSEEKIRKCQEMCSETYRHHTNRA